ncbi:aa3-type cytochrome c oxidase subunit IV [Marinicauda salina]|uniref:Aa3-type cytochrome c oxidase subunit IV n=1 Tax=Marinicauda salina TaxID=2135793 RepID=A0A2U2BXA5_9PROT|nr:aa3-type cytochrome c oxidase subunit IV [Marinicauda salina]PWE18646.1 aa3-type cytochrome c oxidase subunit IV [Marinicauda salina]
MAAEHTRGDMDITMQKRTFEGVMGAGVLATLITGVTILFLTLVFATDVAWFPSLVVTLIAGGAAGAALKRGAAYWASLVALTGIALIGGVLVTAFGA